MADTQTDYESRIRSYLNPAIAGKFTSALIAALAAGDAINGDNIQAVKNNLFIATATAQYLDKIAAGIGITRPPGVGISDDTFRELAISQTNNKLVSNIFLEILELFYGIDAIRANTTTVAAEPYTLANGETLQILQDGNLVPLTITFNASDFSSIGTATANEVANAISKSAFNAGYTLTADVFFDSTLNQNFVQLISGTRGPKSAITVIGGQAQNSLLFPKLKPTTQTTGTQYTLSIAGNNVRFTWTSGSDPSLQFVTVGDYANIWGSGFTPNNQGAFPVVTIQSGTVGNAFFEIQNGAFTSQAPVSLGTPNDVAFFKPVRNVIQQQARYASVYEVNPYEVVVFLPVTTQIIKRDLIGSAHLHAGTPDPTEVYNGPYVFDPTSGFSIEPEFTTINTPLTAGQVFTVINVANSANFPDEEGFVVFDYGTSNQEGPVRYFGRPSSGSIQLDPSYKFQKTHNAGADITLIFQRKPFIPSIDGTDFGFYVTGTVNGSEQAQALIQQLSATGIFLRVLLIFPNGPGMQDIGFIYGPDQS